MSPGASPKRPLDSLISVDDFEQAASEDLNPKTWAFISSAATDLYTKRRNKSAYSEITLRPRILRNVAHLDLSTEMLGGKLRLPIFCSPAAMATLVHPEGEKDIGRACKASGMAQCVSTSAAYPLKDIVAAINQHEAKTAHNTPVYFQLYVDKNRKRSEELLQQVQKCGATAIFLTVDAPVAGKREADERIKADVNVSSPLSGAKASNDAKGGSLGRTMAGFIDPSVTWEDIQWIRSCAPELRIVLKGVQTCEDAVLAAQAGVDGIVLSNHGGRSLDTSPATILLLLEMRKNCPEVFHQLDVLVDGGITRGTDIFKALCLGAKAVGVGRGALYGLNYGYEGVVKFFDSMDPAANPAVSFRAGR
ncbi:hypothetical protein K4F52_007624 [Lecanicillium sp. MT-2017a]|nr:hypothetical protein K4F52_007624 [Lecanicillium sp. MT-2017a]